MQVNNQKMERRTVSQPRSHMSNKDSERCPGEDVWNCNAIDRRHVSQWTFRSTSDAIEITKREGLASLDASHKVAPTISTSLESKETKDKHFPPRSDADNNRTKPYSKDAGFKFFSNGNNAVLRQSKIRKGLNELPPPRRVDYNTPTPSCKFLQLPYEIRESIYNYIFDSALIIMSNMENFGVRRNADALLSPNSTEGITPNVFPCLGPDDANPTRQLKLPNEWLGRRFHYINLPFERKYQNGKHELPDYEGSHWLDSNLLFTCRQVAREFAPMLYSRTALAFASCKKLRKFLDVQDKLAMR